MPLTMNQEPRTKNTKPLVSVCIGVYNRERYIRECLDSVFAQTYPNLEVIVVDDASTDRSVEILETYGDRITLIRREKNSGCADIPRAQAMEVASGDLCALLDSDDSWMPNKLERQVVFMLTHQNVVLSHTYVRVLDELTGQVYIRHEGVIPDLESLAPSLLEHCFISTSSVMVKREVWLDAFRKINPNCFGTEWDIFLSIAKVHPIGFLDEVLAEYRKSSAGVSQGRWRRVEGDLWSLKRIYAAGLWRGILSPADMRERLLAATHEGAAYWIAHGKAFRAIWFACQGLQLQPWNLRSWRYMLSATAGQSVRYILRVCTRKS